MVAFARDFESGGRGWFAGGNHRLGRGSRPALCVVLGIWLEDDVRAKMEVEMMKGFFSLDGFRKVEITITEICNKPQ